MSQSEKDNDLEKINRRLDEQHALVEQRIDAQEELLANLMMAYAEVASTIETVIQEIMAPRDEAEKQKFRQALNDRHATTLKMIREVANDVERGGPANFDQSILTMAAKQQADTTNSKRDDASGDEK